MADCSRHPGNLLPGCRWCRTGTEPDELAARERQQALTILSGIPRRRTELADQERALVHNARQCGITWAEIADKLGMGSGWRARMQYGEPEPDDD